MPRFRLAVLIAAPVASVVVSLLIKYDRYCLAVLALAISIGIAVIAYFVEIKTAVQTATQRFHAEVANNTKNRKPDKLYCSVMRHRRFSERLDEWVRYPHLDRRFGSSTYTGVVGRCFRSGEMIHVPDAGKNVDDFLIGLGYSRRDIQNLPADYRLFRSYLCAPIRTFDGSIVGVVSAFSFDGATFSAKCVELIGKFSIDVGAILYQGK